MPPFHAFPAITIVIAFFRSTRMAPCTIAPAPAWPPHASGCSTHLRLESCEQLQHVRRRLPLRHASQGLQPKSVVRFARICLKFNYLLHSCSQTRLCACAVSGAVLLCMVRGGLVLQKRDVEVRKVQRRRCHPCCHDRPSLQSIPVSTKRAHQHTAVSMHGGECGWQIPVVSYPWLGLLAAWKEGKSLFTARRGAHGCCASKRRMGCWAASAHRSCRSLPLYPAVRSASRVSTRTCRPPSSIVSFCGDKAHSCTRCLLGMRVRDVWKADTY